MIESVERIERQTRGGRQAFEADELVQTWVVHHLEILGEAARGVSPDLQGRHPEVRWGAIVALRNVLTHHYFGVDVERVWTTLDAELPALKRQLETILRGLEADQPEP